MDWWIVLIIAGVVIVTGFVLGYLYRKYIIDTRAGSVAEKATALVENAKKDAINVKKEAIIEGKEEIQHLKARTEDDIRKHKSELKRIVTSV